MKKVYCENCGTCLSISRKAMPRYGTIIDLVEYHECPPEPVPFELEPAPAPAFVKEGKKKFVQKLNDLSPRTQGMATVHEQNYDKRSKDNVKSSAPSSVIEQMMRMRTTSPEADLSPDYTPEDNKES